MRALALIAVAGFAGGLAAGLWMGSATTRTTLRPTVEPPTPTSVRPSASASHGSAAADKAALEDCLARERALRFEREGIPVSWSDAPDDDYPGPLRTELDAVLRECGLAEMPRELRCDEPPCLILTYGTEDWWECDAVKRIWPLVGRIDATATCGVSAAFVSSEPASSERIMSRAYTALEQAGCEDFASIRHMDDRLDLDLVLEPPSRPDPP